MRRQIWIGGLCCLLALSAAVAFSQDGEKVRGLVNQLGDEDFAVRQQAEKRILDLGEKAIPALEEAAKDHPDTHVRYEAARLLATLRAAAKPERPLREPGTRPDVLRLEQWLEELLSRLEGHGLLGEDDLEQLRKMLETPMPGAGVRVGGGTVSGTVQTGDRRIEYRQEPDGRVKVTVTEDGQTKTYEAESLSSLRETNPEIADLVAKHFGDFRISIRDGSLPGFGPLPPAWPRALRDLPLREKDAAPAEGDRLGIWVGEITEPLRSHLRLADDEGLLVESVVPGSLADRLGIQRFDVVTKVNGAEVGGPEDVRKALEPVAPGGQVELTVIRQGKATSLVGSR